jgi:hypothetical protein
MNRKVRLAVLRILILLEEFSPEELAEAVSHINGQPTEDLLGYLARSTSSSKDSSAPRPHGPGLSTEGETLALQALKSTDTEKYQILKDLEGAIREDRALKSMGEVRKFATLLDKDFNPGKSRKEALGRLIALLAKMDIAAIRTAIGKMPMTSDGTADSFRRLANQLISGQPDRPAESA